MDEMAHRRRAKLTGKKTRMFMMHGHGLRGQLQARETLQKRKIILSLPERLGQPVNLEITLREILDLGEGRLGVV